MVGRALTIGISVAIAVLIVVTGFVVYQFYMHPTVTSENWAGYLDPHSVENASASIALPSSPDWQGSGSASVWVGLGGAGGLSVAQWPFWQAGVDVTCSASGSCTAELFDEGGTQGAPCNGVCAPDWTQAIGVSPGDTISVFVSGGSLGSVATFRVDSGGVNTSYDPPVWSVLAGVTQFPSAEWIFESPTSSSTGQVIVMPSLAPPGVQFSGMADSAGLASTVTIQMSGNPNGQTVSISSLSGNSFTAYSHSAS